MGDLLSEESLLSQIEELEMKCDTIKEFYLKLEQEGKADDELMKIDGWLIITKGVFLCKEYELIASLINDKKMLLDRLRKPQ